MIVRIQGEGQFDLQDSSRRSLDELDSKLFEAIDANDEVEYARSLQAVDDFVRSAGSKVPDEQLVSSDIILPSPDTTLEEARKILTDEGYLKPVEA